MPKSAHLVSELKILVDHLTFTKTKLLLVKPTKFKEEGLDYTS